MSDNKPSAVEDIKRQSRFLRGSLAESLAIGTTAALVPDDTKLSKFHGVYQQDDRDLRAERGAQKLEPAYDFMIRIRVPGGILTPAQWLAVDELARAYSKGTVRLTTRQSIQLHGVLKRDLKPAMQAIANASLTTIAACGDVSRNVVSTSLPEQSALHRAVYDKAMDVVSELTPATSAYSEVWLDERKHALEQDSEPLYGPTYLPRKFKVGFVVPPVNDIDVYAQDLGFVAIAERGELAGFNVLVGGGMGMTHGDAKTYPRLAEAVGFCFAEQMLDVTRHVVGIQRDFGNRSDRSRARFKYTIDDRGIGWFEEELARRMGFALEPARPARLTHTGDTFGWTQGEGGKSHLLLHVPSGRVQDQATQRYQSGIAAIARVHDGDLRITANQNLIVANVSERSVIDRLVEQYGLDSYTRLTPFSRTAMACVALPTCGLAMAESERYLPHISAQIEALLVKHGLQTSDLLFRMTGCPNGCARPYLAEIALVGKAPGRYNLFLGGAFSGERLNELYRQNIAEDEILAILDELLGDYATRRKANEPFGDFVHRVGVVGAARESDRIAQQ